MNIGCEGLQLQGAREVAGRFVLGGHRVEARRSLSAASPVCALRFTSSPAISSRRLAISSKDHRRIAIWLVLIISSCNASISGSQIP